MRSRFKQDEAQIKAWQASLTDGVVAPLNSLSAALWGAGSSGGYVSAAWTGAGATACRNLINQVHDELNKLITELQRIADFLGEIAKVLEAESR